MHRAPRRSPALSLCAVLSALVGACSGGDDQDPSFGSNTNPTSVTNPVTSVGTDSDPGTTAVTTDVTTGVVDPTTGAIDPMTGTTTEPGTTTSPDGTTTSPDGTTTNPDGTTTNPDGTTTEPDGTTTDPDGTTTNDQTTGDPPGKDPQPAAGLYSDCSADPMSCNNQTDGCFSLNDDMMMVIDGYCTILCTGVADCGAAPDAPATQECLDIGNMQKVCALKCNGVADCPTGMSCEGIQLPNMKTGNYCF